MYNVGGPIVTSEMGVVIVLYKVSTTRYRSFHGVRLFGIMFVLGWRKKW